MTMSHRSSGVIVLMVWSWTVGPMIAHAEDHAVDVSAGGFDPAAMTIVVGDTVIWDNTGGQHNVVADDGSFESGPPSTDAWQFARTFHDGGVVLYHCAAHPTTEIGTITVGGLFGDDFESGDTMAWTETVQPGPPNCDCYFSADCVEPNGFCDWGILTEEDTCTWRENKPDGVPGAGCDVGYEGPWIAGICDGACSPSTLGSRLGHEDRGLIERGIQLWAEALLRPAEAGGGPVDPDLAAQAMALDFVAPEAAVALGRQVADVLVVAGVPAFGDHFCHYEGHPDEADPDLYVSLLADPCRQRSARQAVAALVAEVREAGSADGTLGHLRGVCADWQRMFGPRCTGAAALDCVEQRIADLAVFLTTPRARGTHDLFGLPTWLRRP